MKRNLLYLIFVSLIISKILNFIIVAHPTTECICTMDGFYCGYSFASLHGCKHTTGIDAHTKYNCKKGGKLDKLQKCPYLCKQSSIN